MRPIMKIISWGLLFIAFSYCGAMTDAVEAELQRLALDIPSLYLVNGLFLSADQNKQLAGYLTESAKIHEQNQLAIRQFIQGHQRETELLVDQMIAGKNETPAGKVLGKGKQTMELRKVREEWQNLINRNRRSLDELAQKTLAMLTPAQCDILDRFVPCFIPPGDFRSPERVGQADAGTSLGETMLARLRKAPPAKLNDAIERSLDGLVPYVMKEQHLELTKPQIDKLRDELRPPLKELADRVRSMKDSDFELEKGNLAKQFLHLQNAETGKQGAADELMKIKRYILNPGIVSVIARRAGDPGADFKAEVARAAAFEDIKQKNDTFQTAQLMNALQLTAGQARQLMPCVQQAVTARAEIEIETAIISPKARQAYQALKAELENQQSSPQTEKEAAKYHHELKMLSMDKLATMLLACETEMDRILSADQVAFLIGRRSGKKTERLQNELAKDISHVRSRARELFDAMDNMKEREFAGRAHNSCVNFVEECISSGAVDPNAVDKNTEISRAEQLLARAKNMRHTEYVKARDDLIAEICPRRAKPRTTMFGWQKSMGDQLEVVASSTELILSQTGLALLEKKIQLGN